MPEVPATKTPATRQQLAAAMAKAAPDLTPHQRALLLAHISIETNNGKSLRQHNPGNFTVSKAREADTPFWRPPWYLPPGPDASERIRRLHEGMLNGTQPRAFRAFASLEEGMAHYVSRMRGRYSPMLRADSPQEFVQEWRNTGYTPDLDVDRTTPGFVWLYEYYGGDKSQGQASSGGLLLGAGAAVGVLLWLKHRSG